MTRLTLICGSLEPQKDGVGDYCMTLAVALRRLGVSVKLLGVCDKHVSVEPYSYAETLCLPAAWSAAKRYAIDSEAVAGWASAAAKNEPILSARDVIVPSIWHETISLFAINAAAVGRPVIASESGELPFIIKNGNNVLIAEAGNVKQLASAIDEIAGNLASAQEVCQNNRLKYLALCTANTHFGEAE